MGDAENTFYSRKKNISLCNKDGTFVAFNCKLSFLRQNTQIVHMVLEAVWFVDFTCLGGKQFATQTSIVLCFRVNGH